MSTTPSLVKRHPLATLFFLVGALAWLLENRAWAVGGWTGLHGSADAGYYMLMLGTRHVDFIDWS